MPVHVTRKRKGVWYAGGSVRVGQETATVPERSTGCRAKPDAEQIAARWDREARDRLLTGGKSITIGECLAAYLQRPGGVRSYDEARIVDLNEHTGHYALADAASAWGRWLAVRGVGMQPPSVARWRSTYRAAIAHGAAVHGMAAAAIPSVRGGGGTERVRYLTDDERRRLLAAYNPHAACPILLLAYQGMRTQEALQLDWRHVSLDRREIFIPADQAKQARGRTIPMHRRVDALLFGMWHAAGCPEAGPVFLSSRGEPYADTRGRGERAQGGNPLAQAHDTACARAGVERFRVHDWRHDWAHRMVVVGVDLRTLMDLGGWSSLRMVTRYAATTATHRAAAMEKLA